MLSEAMLSYYLSKALMISKEKLRFLSFDHFIAYNTQDSKSTPQTGIKKPAEQVNMVKVNVEIIDSQSNQKYCNINKILLKVKAEIRDGTSILYDLQPTNLTINLGQSGIASR